MNIKAFINHINKTRPVYANFLEWLEPLLHNWRKTMPKITIIAPCPNCNHGGARLTHYKWFKTPAHSWIKNVWVHHGCKDGDRRVSWNSHEYMVRGAFRLYNTNCRKSYSHVPPL